MNADHGHAPALLFTNHITIYSWHTVAGREPFSRIGIDWCEVEEALFGFNLRGKVLETLPIALCDSPMGPMLEWKGIEPIDPESTNGV